MRSKAILERFLFAEEVPSQVTIAAFARFIGDLPEEERPKFCGGGDEDTLRKYIAKVKKEDWPLARSRELLSLLARFCRAVQAPTRFVSDLRHVLSLEMEREGRGADPYLVLFCDRTLYDQLLIYVATPARFLDSVRDDWRILCLHGKVDLFRASLVVFVQRHLDRLSAGSTHTTTLALARDLARACITYGDYAYAQRITRAIVGASGSSVPPTDPRRRFLYFEADRLHAEASAFVALGWEDQAATFKKLSVQAENRLRRANDLEAGEQRDLELRFLDVLLRTWTRIKFQTSAAGPRMAVGPIEEMTDITGLDVIERHERLADLLGVRQGDQGFGDLNGMRYVYCDTFVRSMALIEGDPDRAERFQIDLESREFPQDREFRAVFHRYGLGDQPDLVRLYRSKTTRAMILCKQAELLEAKTPAELKNKALELALRARTEIQEMVTAIDASNMFHTRHSVAFLLTKLTYLESYYGT